jgi:hypothetical protein
MLHYFSKNIKQLLAPHNIDKIFLLTKADSKASLRLIRSHFKISPQTQSLRWIEVANPRNPALAGLLWLSPSIRLDLDLDKMFLNSF